VSVAQQKRKINSQQTTPGLTAPAVQNLTGFAWKWGLTMPGRGAMRNVIIASILALFAFTADGAPELSLQLGGA
jgi:hypothetical protein